MGQTTALRNPGLKLLPAYTHVTTLEEALADPRSLRVLWLEILFNDRLDTSRILASPAGREAYQKACRWYTAYRSLIESVIVRSALPQDHGPIDQRDYRTFVESALTLDHLIRLLQEYVRDTRAELDLLLIGRLALYAYGAEHPQTEDLDAEIVGDFDRLVAFLKQRQVLTNLSENISGWSVVAMPPGYRERATVYVDESGLRIRLLAPVDFVIAKLRRGTEQDLDDAMFVVRKFAVSSAAVQASADRAVTASPKDTALFAFRQTVELFCRRLKSVQVSDT